MKVTDFQILEKVKNLAYSQKKTFKEVSEGIGMTEQGLSSSLRNGTIKLETLIKLSNFFSVNTLYLLGDEKISESPKHDDNLIHLIDKIEKQMQDQQEQLKRKDEQISQLLATNNALVMASLGKDEPVHYKDRLAA